MRMRWLGQVQLIGLIAAFAAFAAPSQASDCNQCASIYTPGAPAQAEAQPAEAPASATAESEQVSKPLPLVNRKTRKPRKEARKEKPAATVAEKPAEKSVVEKSVKDARAQATETATPYAAPDADITAADRFPTPETPVVSADEVNEIDEAAAPQAQAATRTSTEAPRTNAPQATVATEPPPRLSLARVEAPEAVTVAESRDGAWEQSSLIGKIFIAMGGLLTAASAIRMFIG